VVESNGQDVHVPWFSGLCLEREVAGQYEIDRSGSQQEHQETTKAGLLELDGLAPITIFVGANNSGKSRLMRELFSTRSLSGFKLKCSNAEDTEVEIGSMLPAWTVGNGVVTFDETIYSPQSWIDHGGLLTGKMSECQVTLFARAFGVALAHKAYDTCESSERAALKELLASLDLEGVLIQADALHITQAFFTGASPRGATSS
jgi:hypothetical protein